MVLASAWVAPLSGQESSSLRPAVVLSVVAEDDQLADSAIAARRLAASAIEGRIRSALRYRLSRTTVSGDLEGSQESWDSADSAAILVRLAPRRDGSLRVELDLWYSGAYRWSAEEDLPDGNDRVILVDALATALERELAALYPGFGRISFVANGAPIDYFIFANGEYVGANLAATELLVGEYEIEIRRRDDGFEHVVGRSTIQLDRQSFYELVFRLEEIPPPVPGYLRLASPEDRWKRLFDISALYAIPFLDDSEVVDMEAAIGLATAAFNDVLFRGHLVGLQAGYIGTWYEEDSISSQLDVTPVLLTTGGVLGPVAGFDALIHVGAGVAATASDFEYRDADGNRQRFDARGGSPVFSGGLQFGYRIVGPLRLSSSVQTLVLVENGEPYVWLGFGVGLGARF